MPLAITGATGRLGGAVARALSAEQVPLRLLVRDAARAPQLPGADVAVAPYGDAAAVRTALAGITTVLMVSASESADRVAQHVAFLDAAAAAGVQHVVYTSFVGAAADATFTLARDHAATEAHLRALGLRWTVVRDDLYADVLPEFAVDGVLRGPAGDGRVAAVARADVAAALTAVLRAPAEHADRTYELTGPEALTLEQVAELITEHTGRAVRYERETREQAYASRAASRAPTWQLDAWVSTYLAIADGSMSRVTGDVEQLTGHPPLSLADVLSRPGG